MSENNGIGKKRWLIPDGFIPVESCGDRVSHESICILNLQKAEANIELTFYFEDRDPLGDFHVSCGGERTNHIRIDKLENEEGAEVPTGVPYALKLESDINVVVQMSRMDTGQPELALMTSIAWPV